MGRSRDLRTPRRTFSAEGNYERERNSRKRRMRRRTWRPGLSISFRIVRATNSNPVLISSSVLPATSGRPHARSKMMHLSRQRGSTRRRNTSKVLARRFATAASEISSTTPPVSPSVSRLPSSAYRFSPALPPCVFCGPQTAVLHRRDTIDRRLQGTTMRGQADPADEPARDHRTGGSIRGLELT